MTTAELNIFVRIRAAEAQRQMALLRTQIQALEAAAARGNATSNRPWFQNMSKEGSRLQWMGRQLMTNVTAPLALAGGMAIKWGLDNEAAMARVKKVYGDVGMETTALDNELRALDRTFTALSNTYGISKAEVTEVAAAWTAAGSSGLALAKQTELTMKTMVLGEMEATEATQSLIAIQAQYGQNTDGLIRTIQQLNAVENVTGTTLGGLVVGFSRAAGVARTAGVDTAHLAAMIAALSPAAGSANEAGNALKTIMSRLMSPTGEAADVMREMGIQLDSTAWQAMNATERMEFMAKGFEGLTNPQKATASALIASRWQINKFEIAMREMASTTGYYAKSLAILSNEQEVQAIAERELQTVLQSNPQKVKQAANIVKNALTDAFLPVIPVFVQVMQWFGKLAQSFANLPTHTRSIILVMALLAAALGPVILMMGLMKLAIGQLVPLFLMLARFALLPLAPFKLLYAALAMVASTSVLYMRVAVATVFSAMSSIASIIAGSASFQIIWARVLLGMQAVTASGMAVIAGVWRSMLFTMLFYQTIMAAARGKFWTLMFALDAARTKGMLVIQSARHAASRMIDTVAYALNIALFARFSSAMTALQVAHNRVMLTLATAFQWAWIGVAQFGNKLYFGVMTGFWTTFLALQTAMWRLSAAIQGAWQISMAALSQAWYMAQLALARTYYAASAALAAGWSAASLAISRAWGAAWVAITAVFSRAVMAVHVAFSIAFLRVWQFIMTMSWARVKAMWVGIVAMTKGGVMGVLAVMKNFGKWFIAALTSPIGLAIGVVVALLLIFKDEIRNAVTGVIDYFKNMPSGIATALAPIGRFFGAIRDMIVRAFNALPESVKNALLAVVRIVKAAALAVYDLFSYFNPFAHHSPSLVENVTNGMAEVSAQFNKAANDSESSIDRMYRSMKALGEASKGAMGGEVAAQADDKRKTVAKVAPEALPSYDGLIADLERVKVQMDAADQAVKRQEESMKNLQAAMDAADKTIKVMNKSLDSLKDMQDAMSDAVERAKQSYERYSNAQIKGMGEAEDAIFANEMAQKKLQLQLSKLKQANPDIESIADSYKKVQGEIEMLTGMQSDLRAKGAGSDILGPYDDMIAKLQKQQADLAAGATSGPAAEIEKLEKALEKLQTKAEQMDLEKSLKFDPLTRQLEQLKNATEELPFDQIVSGLRTSQTQIDIYTAAFDAATLAVQAQEAAIESAQTARDAMGEAYDMESEKLDMLKDNYSQYEEAVRQGEQALEDITATADAAIQRMENARQLMLQAIRLGLDPGASEEAVKAAQDAKDLEDAYKSLEEAQKKAKGEGGDEYISPGLQNFRDGAAGDFADTGEGFSIGREGGLGDQSAQIDEYTKGLTDEIAKSLGGMNPFQFLIDWWNKTKEWFSTNIGPMLGPLQTMFSDLGKTVGDAFGGENSDKISTLAQWIRNVKDWVVNAWDVVTGFGAALGRLFGPDLQATIKEVVNGLMGMWETIQPKLKDLLANLQPVFDFLKLVGSVVITSLLAIIEVVWEVVNGAIGPAFSIIGDIIGGVIDIVKGLFRIFGGLAQILIGVFTLDPSKIWEGIKNIVAGIGNIFGGLWDMVYSIFTNAVVIIRNVVFGFVKGIFDFFYWLWDELVGHSIVPDMINAIVEWFLSLPGKILSFIWDMITSIAGFFMELPGKIFAALATLAQFIWDAFVAASVWLAENLPGMIGAVVQFFIDLPGKIWDALMFLREKLHDAIWVAINWLIENLGPWLGKVLDFFIGLPQQIWDALWGLNEKLGNAIWVAIDYLVAHLPEWIGNIVQFFIDLPGKILGALGNAGTMLLDFGKNIIQGLLDGAGELLPKIGEFFLDKLPGWIKEPFKKAMGIHSPSTLFAEFGVNTGEGFIQGLEAQMPAIESASQAMADAAANISTPELAAPTLAATAGTDATTAVTGDVADAMVAATADARAAWDAYVTYMTSSTASFATAQGATFASMSTTISASYTGMLNGMTTATATFTATVNTQMVTFANGQQAIFTQLSSNVVVIITNMVDQLKAKFELLDQQLTVVMTQTSDGVTGQFQTMADKMNTTLTDSITPVFDGIEEMLTTMEESFKTTVDNVGTTWDGIKEKTAAPARFVINDVYNDGIRGAWNQFNGFLGLPPLNEQVAKFATGGAVDVWGTGGPTSDRVPAMLSKGEHVITAKEVQGAGGHAAIEATRKYWEAGKVGAFARGGPVDIAAPAWTGGGGEANLKPAAILARRNIHMYWPEISTIGGYRANDPYPDHPSGLALDIMTGDPIGTQVNDWLHQNMAPLALNYTIWKQFYKPAGGGGNLMEDRGSPTQNHMDHVHALFNANGVPGIQDGGAGAGPSIPMDQMVRDAINQRMDAVLKRAPEIAGGIGQWIPKSIEKGRNGLLDKLVPMAKAATQAMSAAGNIGSAESWRGMAIEAMRRQGFDYNDNAQVDAMLRQIMSESTGNAKAIQQVIDINSGGNEAGGLLQMTPGTYAAYRDPELVNDRFDAWSNMNAALRYYRATYGDNLTSYWGQGHGYDSGGYLEPGVIGNFTGASEPVLTTGQWAAMYSIADSAQAFGPDVVEEGTVNAMQSVYGLDPMDSIQQGIIDGNILAAAEWTPSIYDAADNIDGAASKFEEGTEATKGAMEQFKETGAEIKKYVDATSKMMLAISTAASSQTQDFNTWVPVINAAADLISTLPDAEATYVPWAGYSVDYTDEMKRQKLANDAANFAKGTYQIFKDVAPSLLKHGAAIGGAVTTLVAQNAPIVSAAIAMAPVNPVGAAIMMIPVILQAIFTILPMIVNAILDIVPTIITAIERFFQDFGPDAVFMYDDLAAANQAVKDNESVIKDNIAHPDKWGNPTVQGSGGSNQPVNINIYGDVSMPNVTNQDGASTFISNLTTMAEG